MRAKPVTADEQYRLIMECRSSGLTDYQWCIKHNIKPGSFYNWVKRLRQKGFATVPSMEAEAISESVSCSASAVPELPVLELSIGDMIVRIP